MWDVLISYCVVKFLFGGLVGSLLLMPVLWLLFACVAWMCGCLV